MFGGLKKSASRLALVAAAGVLSTNAFAADLGGDCCADLEERVAELEATTARKGTRKTSLEVWGQVNKIIVAWNDGINKNVTLGTDNTSASTRFGFRGMAKVHPGLTAGYSIVIEQGSGATTTGISQFQDKGGINAISGGNNSSLTANGLYFNTGSNDPLITMREANWWLESSTVGRLTVGRFVNTAGVTGQIDLAGIGLTAASGSVSIIGTGLTFRTNNANNGGATPPSSANGLRGTLNYTNYTLGNTTDNKGEYASRENGVMYTSPTLAGFTLAASVANTLNADTQCNAGNSSLAGTATVLTGCGENYAQGPIASVNLKYAGESGGFRYAAAIGYEDSNNANATSMFGNNGTSLRQHSTNAGLSTSLMHVPTGLFAQGFSTSIPAVMISTTTLVARLSSARAPTAPTPRIPLRSGWCRLVSSRTGSASATPLSMVSISRRRTASTPSAWKQLATL